MKLYSFLFAVFLLGFTNYTRSQNLGDEQQLIKRNTIKFAPINLFDPINPTFLIDYEYLVTPELSLQVGFGYVLKQSCPQVFMPDVMSDEYLNSYSGYRIDAEVKSILNSRGRKVKHNLYIAMEVFYLRNDINKGKTNIDVLIQENIN